MVFSVLSDGREVLVARFATRILALDFVEYQSTISDDTYEIRREGAEM